MKGNTERTLQTVNGGTHGKKVAKEDVKNALKNVRPLVCGLVVDVENQNLRKTFRNGYVRMDQRQMVA